jgi:hypothetical protein
MDEKRCPHGCLTEFGIEQCIFSQGHAGTHVHEWPSGANYPPGEWDTGEESDRIKDEDGAWGARRKRKAAKR